MVSQKPVNTLNNHLRWILLRVAEMIRYIDVDRDIDIDTLKVFSGCMW